MTSRESKGNVVSSTSDNSIGMIPANDFTKVAVFNGYNSNIKEKIKTPNKSTGVLDLKLFLMEM